MNKEFVMQDVFHKVTLRRIKKTFDKKHDLSQQQTKEFSLPLINAKNGDNGIMYYGRMEDWESDTYCIDIVNDGAISTGNVYVQPQRTGVLYNAYMIKPNMEIESEAILLYLAKCIEKSIKTKFGYDNKATWTKVKEMTISLPVIENTDSDHVYTVDDIDWQYMQDRIAELEQDRIAELEQDRIAELEAYLAATGLDDYELTAEDKAVLGDEKVMAEFKVEDVFGTAKLGKYHNPKDLRLDTNGYEYICASNTNNGINVNMPLVNGNNLSLTEPNIVAWGKQCPMFTYHPNECVTSQGMYYLKLGEHTKSEALYIIGVLSRVCEGYCYTNCLIGSKMDETVISLPVIESSDPFYEYTVDDIDWQYMERYIRAMEKITIADVVKYKDKVIATTKEIVEQ